MLVGILPPYHYHLLSLVPGCSSAGGGPVAVGTYWLCTVVAELRKRLPELEKRYLVALRPCNRGLGIKPSWRDLPKRFCR